MDHEDSEEVDCAETEVPSPLHIAASTSDTAELSRLLSISHDRINARDPCQYTPLQISIQNNDLASVNALISHGADASLEVPNAYSDLVPGTNALSLAASCGHSEVLRVLVENGCPVTSMALYTAAESGKIECVEKVLNCVIKDGRGFDDVAVGEGIGAGLLVAAVGWRSETVQVILRHSEVSNEAVDCALLGALREVLEYDEFHITNPVSRTTITGYGKRTETVKLLIDAGADVNAEGQLYMYSSTGMRPLHQARMGNRAIEIFDLLLDNRADINSKDEDRRTQFFMPPKAITFILLKHLLRKVLQ